jgi:sulfatase-like protein
MTNQGLQKPSILFFHMDNVSVGDFGCYGGAYPLGAKTPNIDRFASQGLQLTNYNVEAQCTPSRSALMTGVLLGQETGIAPADIVDPEIERALVRASYAGESSPDPCRSLSCRSSGTGRFLSPAALRFAADSPLE